MMTLMPLWNALKSKIYINGILEEIFNLAMPCNCKIKNLITIINIHYHIINYKYLEQYLTHNE